MGLVRDGKLLARLDTGTGFPIACCLADASRLLVTVAETQGQPLMAALAGKTVATQVIAYDIGASLPEEK